MCTSVLSLSSALYFLKLPMLGGADVVASNFCVRIFFSVIPLISPLISGVNLCSSLAKFILDIRIRSPVCFWAKFAARVPNLAILLFQYHDLGVLLF